MLEVHACTLVGHSLGGGIATAVAERMGEAVRSLVLSAPVGFGRVALAEVGALPLVRDLAGWLLPHVVTRAPLVEAIYSGLVTSGAAPSADLRARLVAEGRRLGPGVRAGWGPGCAPASRPSPPRGARRMRFIAGASLTTAQ